MEKGILPFRKKMDMLYSTEARVIVDGLDSFSASNLYPVITEEEKQAAENVFARPKKLE